MHYSADKDARRVKKGSKCTLGFKGFARTDEEGYIDKVHVTPANVGESPEFGTMIEGASGQRVPADKAYAGKANRASLKGQHRDGIMRKAARNRPLRQSEKPFQQANLQTSVPGRAVLWHDETSLRSTPRALLRCR